MASLDSVIKLWKVVGGNHIGAGRACKLSKLHTKTPANEGIWTQIISAVRQQ